MRNSCSYSSGGNTGGARKKSTRNRPNRTRRVSHKQEYEESGFFSQITSMESTIRAQALSARLHFYRHQAAWWKSQFVAAQFENRMLRQLLDQHYQTPRTSYLPKPSSSHNERPNSKKDRRPEGSDRKFTIPSFSEVQSEDSEDSVENGDYELSEEFKQFLDINRQHREERDREKAQKKRERGSESETERVGRMEQEPLDAGKEKRHEQLMQLYGERWWQVEGLETHVQMKHDQFCDRHQPIYWPNIPLNL